LLHGSAGTIHGNHAEIDESYLAIAGLNSREDKTVNQDGKALAARQRSHNVRRPPGLGENLCAICVLGAINEADIIG